MTPDNPGSRRPRVAKSAQKPVETQDEFGKVVTSAIMAYGDTLHTFVQRTGYTGAFMPGYREMPEDKLAKPVGLLHIDHCVGNVGWNAMSGWRAFTSLITALAAAVPRSTADTSIKLSGNEPIGVCRAARMTAFILSL
jgi:4-hydroxyphenylpyruvate dioxygenase-like putative hemolysin